MLGLVTLTLALSLRERGFFTLTPGLSLGERGFHPHPSPLP